jgi:hypothetical protein
MWILALSPMWVPLSGSAQEECGLFPLETGAKHGCSLGTGRVTVVLAAGARQTSRTWLSLRSRLTSSARVVTFDRPGLAESPAGQSPRTPTRIAQELRKVLEALGPSGPLVLVGHSIWMEGSREWLDLSSRSRLAVAEGSGHMVHHDRQEIVVEYVLSMIAVAESSSTGWRPAKGALLASCTGGGGGTSAPREEHGSRREGRSVEPAVLVFAQLP